MGRLEQPEWGGEAEAVRLIFAATALWWPKMLRQCAKNYNPMGYLTRGVS